MSETAFQDLQKIPQPPGLNVSNLTKLEAKVCRAKTPRNEISTRPKKIKIVFLYQPGDITVIIQEFQPVYQSN